MSEHVVVIPCFNEEERLAKERFLAYVADSPGVRLLMVDDGSTDGTRHVLEELCAASNGRIEMLALEQNRGKAEAVRRGLLHVFADAPTSFGYWDADLSTPLEEIDAFRRVLKEHPAVYLVMGSRENLPGSDIQRKASRHFLGRVFARCAAIALGATFYDTQCGAKLFRNTPGTRWAFRRRFLSRWLFDVEILARLGLLGRRRAAYRTSICVFERPLPVWHDVAGSKIKLLDWFKAGWELQRIWWRYRCCATRRRPIQ